MDIINKNNDYDKKILILMNVFFNYDYIERTLKSIYEQNNKNYKIDIVFLENPSKYSDKIREISKKYKIKHLICNKNIAGQIYELFYNNNKNIINYYDYICLTESDVILDKDCINESLYILNNLNNIGLCYVGLKTQLNKYKEIQHLINSWVPVPKIKSFYAIGHTGIQFIVFKKHYFIKLMETINKKIISSPIARGCRKFFGFSDSNLHIFNKMNNFLSVQTINNKLEHIGWETSIGLNNEYEKLKNYNLKNKIIRINMDLNNYVLKEL